MTSPTIGYLGLGLMGLPMVMRLLAAGYRVIVWNRSQAKTEPAVAAGAVAKRSPAEVAGDSDYLFMCMTDADAVEAVIFGPGGVASADGPKLVVDFSSIAPERTRSIAARLKAEKNIGWIDAPVSGGTPAAKAGTLTVMAGGAEADLESVRPVLESLAQNITLMGPTGAGQTTKLVNQVISGCTMAVVAEAINLAERAGVDATRLADALRGGFADSKPFQLLAPRMAHRAFDDPLGTVNMMLKDLDVVGALGQRSDAILPLTSAASEMLRATVNRGHGEDDISTIILTFAGEDSAGTKAGT